MLFFCNFWDWFSVFSIFYNSSYFILINKSLVGASLPSILINEIKRLTIFIKITYNFWISALFKINCWFYIKNSKLFTSISFKFFNFSFLSSDSYFLLLLALIFILLELFSLNIKLWAKLLKMYFIIYNLIIGFKRWVFTKSKIVVKIIRVI